MGLADLHVHSIHSYDGTATISAILKHTADHTDLDVIAITDHDNMRGVREAIALAPRYGIEVIPGCEVSTKDGHLLTLFVDRPVQAGLSLVDTALEVGRLGGLCIAAHPLAKGVNSLRFDVIEKALLNSGVKESLVGVEAYNGGLVYTRNSGEVSNESGNFPLAQCGNSDAHILEMISAGSTYFEGNTVKELHCALIHQKTEVRRKPGLAAGKILTSYLPMYVLRNLGWAVWNENPGSPITFTRYGKYLETKTQGIYP